MKLISNLASLTIAATLLLQSGSFVHATPLFNIPSVGNHLNDASLTEPTCEGTIHYHNQLPVFVLFTRSISCFYFRF